MEKKKLLLISVSVGLFLIVVVGACILVFSPKKYPDNFNLDDLAIASGVRVGSQPANPVVGQSTAVSAVVENQQTDPANPSIAVGPSGDAAAANGGAVLGAPRVENVIYINGENADSAVRVERLKDGPTATYITIPNPTNKNSEVQTAAAVPTIEVAKAPSAKESQTQSVSAPKLAAKPVAAAKTPTTTTVKPLATTKPAASIKKAPDDNNAAPIYWVQAGAFSKKAGADSTKQYLASKQITSVIMDGSSNGKTVYRVRIGPYTTSNEANYWLTLIRSINGLENSLVYKSKI
ncbi:MAG: hypothetical protein Ta2B_23680 [Termitinemataceae bacterium]|nr:MAG: hypothetical protein Ta2B_23680 [Termitinemataceae bacterium]